MSRARVIPVRTTLTGPEFAALQRLASRMPGGLDDAVRFLIQDGINANGETVEDGMVEGVTPVTDAPVVADLASIVNDDRLLNLLLGNGVATVENLIDRVMFGDIQSIDGVGPATERRLIAALVEAELVTMEVK